MKIGMACPSCGVVDSYDMLWYDVMDGRITAARVHCHHCEAVWTERMD